jgi:TonB-dependent starch-binding outer membrane protein SusC
MKIRKLLFVFAFFYLAVLSVLSQNTTIRGSVSGDGDPLIGVVIKVKEIPELATVTDIDGRFVLQLPSAGKTLSISYLGFQSQEVVVGSQTEYPVKLLAADKSLEEIVVIGYGSMKKRDVIGSISSVSADAVASRSAGNAMEALQGQATGVQVINSSGTPGEAPDIRIRGTGTFGDGYKPLYVVDGAIQDNIDNLNPSDIASMEVLKDAASAAIYGSRSGNGVILITTKSGIVGQPKLEIKYLHSFGKLGRMIPHANLAQRSWYDKQRKLILAPSTSGFFAFTDTLGMYANADEDLAKALFRVSQRDEINFSVSGASDKGNYFIGAGYYDERAIIINSGYKRLSWRMNADYKFSPKITFGTRQSMSYSHRYGLSGDGSITDFMNHAPYFPVYNTDGTFVPSINSNPNNVALAVEGINYTDLFSASNLNFLEIKLLPNLIFKINIQGNFNTQKQQTRTPQNQVGYGGLYQATESNALNYNWTNENYINHSFKASEHKLDAMLGASASSWTTQNANLKGYNPGSDAVYTLNAVSSFDTKTTLTSISRHSLASAFGRVAYNYKGRYFLTSNVREDGSSRFGSSTKWGLFPSVSLGWRFSDEKLMAPIHEVLQDAKLRMSWGITGNEAIGNYDSKQLYSPGQLYNGVSGIAPMGLSNDFLSWESTEQYNGGLDLSFFNGRLRMGMDAYVKNTSNLLYNAPLPSETGFLTLKKNVGAMKSTGYELSIDGTVLKTKDLKWDLSFNISQNNSLIEKLVNGVPFYQGSNNAIRVHEGGRVGEITLLPIFSSN